MGLLGAIGGFAGSMFGGGDRDEAMRYLEEARKAYEGLDRYADIAPAQEGQSNYLAADPATRAAQMDALTEFQNQYRQGGLNAIDRAKLADIENQTAQTANTTQARVMDDAARRGMATSGNTLVTQQVAGQQAAQRGASNALQVAAQAEQGRMAALSGAAGVAGGVRSQDYQRAAAQDAIDRFNAANRQGAQEQTFQNRLAQKQGIAGVYGAQAGQKNADADYTQRRFAGLGEGLDAAGKVIPGMPEGLF